MIAALLGGAIIALAALGWVLRPLFVTTRRARVARPRGPALPAEDAVDALREVEFDLATGKLSDDDYSVLKARYTDRALAQLRAEDAQNSAAPPRDAESLIAAWREARAGCPDCGPRPESGADFCSNCGRYLPGRCPECGHAVVETASAFCASCGTGLAAA